MSSFATLAADSEAVMSQPVTSVIQCTKAFSCIGLVFCSGALRQKWEALQDDR